MLILQCYCSPCHPIIMLLRRRVTWRPLLVGTEMPLLRGCDLMTVIHAVMMMREGEDVPAWLMIHAAVCLQARGSCLHCPRKTLTGGTPTWCKLTLLFFSPPSPSVSPNRRSRPLDFGFSGRFIPYCSSDVWSGATAKTEQSKGEANEAYGLSLRRG